MTFLDQIKTERRWEFLLLSGVLFFLRQTKKIDPSFVCLLLLKDGKIQRMPHPL